MDELVLAEQGVFLTTDRRGDVPVAAPGALGLYYRDTRFLSGLDVRVDDAVPPLLGVEDHGYLTTLFYGATSHAEVADRAFPADVLLTRVRYLTVEQMDSAAPAPPLLRERLTLTNYRRQPLDVTLAVTLASDFRDLFDVRGFGQSERGRYEPVETSSPGRVVVSYIGRDALPRRTVTALTPAPAEVGATPVGAATGPGATLHWALRLEPQCPVTVDLAIRPLAGQQDIARADKQPVDATFEDGLEATIRAHEAWIAERCTGIETDNASLNRAIGQGLRDLRLLLLQLPTGPYVAAGIPWFAVPFGRDGLITAIETLMVDRDIAVGTLRYLAAHQGRAVNPDSDEEPGKIMHEMRSGETVRAGIMPFGPYYGTVDATPLFLILLGRAAGWIGDEALLRELEPAARAALAWIDAYGDVDGDGYIEFRGKEGRGLANQGWKDSGDSLQFPDGRYPAPPIALVEAQGYVYDARLAAASLLRRLGDEDAAADQERRAATLRDRFNRDFWLTGASFLAQALDADKARVPAVTSNAGHALWSGIVDDERAALLSDRLLSGDMCSGWGIRTLSTGYPSYNPLSYHNGSVWPHDTAIVAAGLKRYGRDAAAATLLEQVVAASEGFADGRLPELYAGVSRQGRERGPVPYPVSCSPQAWAAGSIFLLLQSALGLDAAAHDGLLRLRPSFPSGLNRVSLRRLRVGTAMIDLLVEKGADGHYTVRLSRQSGVTDERVLMTGEAGVIRIGYE